MPINLQEGIWNKNWENRSRVKPEEILGSRFAQEAYRCLKSFVDGNRDQTFLEAGCGTGRLCCLLAQDFPEARIFGVDLSDHSIQIATQLSVHLGLSQTSFQRGDLFNLPFADGSFDVVFNEGVIEHYRPDEKPNYIDAVREMTRVVKKGGKVIVAVPNWYNFPHTLYKWILKRRHIEYKYGYEKSFTKSEVTSLFSSLGLTHIEVSGFYPAHGFYQLHHAYSGKIYGRLGKLVDLFEKGSNRFLKDAFPAAFGIEILVKGIK